ncbi:MAG: ABC transporter ATP-binding protein [Firmicutes bacterium]|nr:ABC transporter ATP-binding protein [Bacillota bacterium]
MSIQILNLSKKFADFKVLSSINLNIKQGEFVAIVGPSGCGKTTLLRLIAGFERPTSGYINMQNKTISSKNKLLAPEQRNIGMVFQNFALWPHMSVKEHILFSLKNHNYTKKNLKKNTKERIEDVLEIVGLKNLANKMPDELSGGQKQRVSLARAIAAHPALLLMDEPLSSLDIALKMDMRREIQTLHQITSATIIYVTHDQGIAMAMADKIVVMNEGKIEQIGKPEDIYTKPETEFVASFVGKANLVPGKWQKSNEFVPRFASHLCWINDNIAQIFHHKDLFPVRPEEFHIKNNKNGIPAVIKNVLYQGKEIHYTVSVFAKEWEIHSNQLNKYQIGDKVSLHYDLEHANIRGKRVIL